MSVAGATEGGRPTPEYDFGEMRNVGVIGAYRAVIQVRNRGGVLRAASVGLTGEGFFPDSARILRSLTCYQG